MKRTAAFIIDLLQDVNVLRPVIKLARNLTDIDTVVVASSKFFQRDTTKLWSTELRDLCGPLNVEIWTFASEYEAIRLLQGRQGILVSASESTVDSHVISHKLFQAVPSTFLKVTLQHGFECVGFLHNDAHDRAYGKQVGSAADVLCGWIDGSLLKSVAASERNKLYVGGPPGYLDTINRSTILQDLSDVTRNNLSILVCENLHSVRLGGSELKSEFLTVFESFANNAVAQNAKVWLRPHPAGRYTIEKGVGLPTGVLRSELPLYKENLDIYRLAVSAPSSILFDMIVADIPVAVWQDANGQIDCGNYNGLKIVSDVEDWWKFSAQILIDPEPVLKRQHNFLDALHIPKDVPARYTNLIYSFP